MEVENLLILSQKANVFSKWPERFENELQLKDFKKFLFCWVFKLINLPGIWEKNLNDTALLWKLHHGHMFVAEKQLQ